MEHRKNYSMNIVLFRIRGQPFYHKKTSFFILFRPTIKTLFIFRTRMTLSEPLPLNRTKYETRSELNGCPLDCSSIEVAIKRTIFRHAYKNLVRTFIVEDIFKKINNTPLSNCQVNSNTKPK